MNLTTDRGEIVAFMQRFSFATIVTAKDGLPLATHLPFLVSLKNEQVVLTSHFAKANRQWEDIEHNNVLVIFSEPHAYVSPTNYDHERNVPTWNYIAVHAYGQGRLLTGTAEAFAVLEATIRNYEASYEQQWDKLPEEYKVTMSKGIVAFEIRIADLQARKKLSQNRTDTERQKIIDTLSKSGDANEQMIAAYMQQHEV